MDQQSTTQVIEQPSVHTIQIPKSSLEASWLLIMAAIPVIGWSIRKVLDTGMQITLKEYEARLKEDEEERKQLNLLIENLIARDKEITSDIFNRQITKN